MKTFKHIGLLGALATVALLAACSDKDDYTPGPEVPSGCQQVRFAPTNNNICVMDTADINDRTATLTLKRNNTGTALAVKITAYSQPAGLQLPAEATFAAGDSLATITIKAPEKVTAKTVYSYELKLEGNDVDPYSKLDGGVVFSGQLNFPISKKAEFYADPASKNYALFNAWTETVMDLGNNNFYIKDFMHSGENLWLITSSTGVLGVKSDSWEKNCIVADTSAPGSYSYYFQKLVDKQLKPYPLYPLGNASGKPWIKELTLYGGPDYSSYSSNGTWGKIYIQHAKYSTGEEENWVYLYFVIK